MSLLKQAVFFEAAGVISKIGSSLNPNHQNQVELVQNPDKFDGKKAFRVAKYADDEILFSNNYGKILYNQS